MGTTSIVTNEGVVAAGGVAATSIGTSKEVVGAGGVVATSPIANEDV